MHEHPYDQVTEFHRAFEHPISRTPKFPSKEIRELRIELIVEELSELIIANDANDLVAVADALADLEYVIQGYAITHGIPLKEVFQNVHRSNLSKLGRDGKPIKREDGKILKGPNYREPTIKAILLKCGYEDSKHGNQQN